MAAPPCAKELTRPFALMRRRSVLGALLAAPGLALAQDARAIRLVVP